MFAIAARRMGYRVHTFSPDDDTPTGQVADVEVSAAYDDLDAVREFARGVEVVTFEFENIPAATAAAAAEFAPVRPGGDVLHTTQHRLREKTFLAQARLSRRAVRAGAVARRTDRRRLDRLGCPAVLKTAGWGYDGKGQVQAFTHAERGGGRLAAAGDQRSGARSVRRLRARGLGRRRARTRRRVRRLRRRSRTRTPTTSSTSRSRPADVPPQVAREASRSPAACWRRSTSSACCASSSF